jgi:hypothetical protein
MADRVYFLLDIGDGKTEQAVATLRQQPGVIMADALEERASIIALVEAENRPRLAQLAVEVLASVETMIENLSLMPVKEEAKGGT